MAARGAVVAALVLSFVTASAHGRAAGPTLTAPPAVSGTLSAGHRLEAGPGTWTSASALTYAYQWHRCNESGAHCASVRGATAPGYALTAADVGKVIGLTVTVSDPSGAAVAYAGLVGPIAGTRPLLVTTAQPQVTGLPAEGKLLQVTTGAWSPMPDRVTYDWQRCNANGRVCMSIPCCVLPCRTSSLPPKSDRVRVYRYR